MKKMQDGLVINKKNIIFDLIEILLLCGFVYCFTHISISTYQVPKDVYFYAGCCCITAVSLIRRGIKNINIWIVLFFAVFFGYILFWHYRHSHDWGNQYRIMLLLKQIMYGLSGVCMLVMLRSKEIVAFRKKDFWFTILLFAVGSFVLIFGQEYLFAVLVPVIVWYTTPMTQKTWHAFLVKLSIGSYMAFIYMMTKSLITSHEFDSGRYIGYFVFPVAPGVLFSLAFVSAVFLYVSYAHNFKPFKRVLFAIALFAYPVISILLVLNRASVLGIILVLAALFVFCSKEKRQSKAIKKSLILAGIFAGVIVLYCVAVKIFINMDLSSLRKLSEDSNTTPGTYLIHILTAVLRTDSRTGVFEGGTIINSLDSLSSTRISIWYLGLKNFRIFGGSELSVSLPNGDFAAHTHCTYLDWILRFGIFGLGIIAWIISYAFLTAREMIKDNKRYLYSFLWVFFCLGLFLTERALWTGLSAFLLLLLQYPLLIDLKEDRMP